MLLSEWIRQARERCGRSQEELAEYLGVNVSTIGHWENGRHAPGPHFQSKMQALFGVDREERPERELRMENEQAGTYFVPPASSQDENTRLHIQAQMIGRMQGGPLTEQPDPHRFQRVLDVGCGTGNWLIEMAQDYPHMTELIGADISQARIAFATEQATRAGVEGRVRFLVRDTLLSTRTYPDEYFDLVNLRFGMSWMRIFPHDNAWLRLLEKIRCVLKPGGTVRLVETQELRANTPGFNRFWELGVKGARQSGHITDEIESVAELFPQFLDAAGFRSIQRRQIDATYRRGDPDFDLLVEDMRLLVKNSEAHLAKWIFVTDYQKLADRINREFDDPSFSLTWTLVTAWGVK